MAEVAGDGLDAICALSNLVMAGDTRPNREQESTSRLFFDWDGGGGSTKNTTWNHCVIDIVSQLKVR